MLQKLKRTDEAGRVRQARQRPARSEKPGKELQARIGDLRNLPREKLADAVFLLSMAAKQQSEHIRRSVLEQAKSRSNSNRHPRGIWPIFLRPKRSRSCAITRWMVRA
jgi:hypothetical protein